MSTELKVQLAEEQSQINTLQSEDSGIFVGIEDAKSLQMTEVYSSTISTNVSSVNLYRPWQILIYTSSPALLQVSFTTCIVVHHKRLKLTFMYLLPDGLAYGGVCRRFFGNEGNGESWMPEILGYTVGNR